MSLIRFRRATAATWTAANYVLAAGEPGVELDTHRQKVGDGSTPWNDLPYVGGGGAPAGVAIVRKFPFSFDTPDLLTGHAVYAPTIGDILLDAWVEVTEAWDGTTPTFDFGNFVGRTNGLFSNVVGAIPMQFADGINNGLLYGSVTSSMVSQNAMYAVYSGVQVDGAGPTLAPRPDAIVNGGRYGAPLKFVEADPIKVCVSQTGDIIGVDPGSTQGAAILYLVTCTPA